MQNISEFHKGLHFSCCGIKITEKNAWQDWFVSRPRAYMCFTYNRRINRLHSLLTLAVVLPCSDHSMTKSFLGENLLYILSHFLPLFFKLISVLCIICSYHIIPVDNYQFKVITLNTRAMFQKISRYHHKTRRFTYALKGNILDINLSNSGYQSQAWQMTCTTWTTYLYKALHLRSFLPEKACVCENLQAMFP